MLIGWRRTFGPAVGLAILLAATVQAQEPAKAPTPLQQAQIRLLQQDQEIAQLRQAVLTLQVQLESLKAPQESQAREQKWKQLESEIGCPVERSSGSVKCPVKAKE